MSSSRMGLHEYRTKLEELNHGWSIRLAQALAKSQDLSEADGVRFLSAQTIALPAMVYLGMLEIVNLNDQLLPAMRDGKIEEAQELMIKLNGILDVFRSLPSTAATETLPTASALIDGAVARNNGRWPY